MYLISPIRGLRIQGEKKTLCAMKSNLPAILLFQNENKMSVIQSIIIHDVIARPKIVLDQLRDGLGTLGFGEQMKKFPELFQKLFVPTDTELTGADVINVLKFPASLSEERTTTKQHLREYLQTAKAKTLQNFLIFATGSPCLPNFGLGKIGVEFDNVPSIYASTCLQKVTLPKSFPDKATFMASMDAAINTVSRSFNCV